MKLRMLGLVLATTWLWAAGSALAGHSVVELVSTGPAQSCTGFCGGGELNDTSSDGRVAIFSTLSQLTADDTNNTYDLYRRAAGTTDRIGGVVSPHTSRISDDGTKIVFSSTEALVAADSDGGKEDVYEHSAAGLRLLSSGPGESGPAEAVSLAGISDDASHVFLLTKQSLVSADADAEWDLYQRAGETLELLSPGGSGATQPWLGPSFRGTAAGDSKVFFVSVIDLLPTDANGLADLYMWSGGELTVVSPPGSIGLNPARLGISPDGDRYAFDTAYHVPPEEDDESACQDFDGEFWTCADVFTYDIGASQANWLSDFQCCSDVFLRAHTADLDRLFIYHDLDNALYEVHGGTRTFVAGGVDHLETEDKVLLSEDGTRLFFRTRSRLVPEDTDSVFDLYERVDGVFRLASTGPLDTNSSGNIFENGQVGISADGSSVFFQSAKQLVPEDTNGALDIYERSGGQTTLISKGPSGQGASLNDSPNMTAVSADGSRVYFHSFQKLVPHDTDQSEDVYLARLADHGGFARPKGATPFRVPLVPAAKPCEAPNRTHGPPLAFGSCAPVQPESPNIAVSQGDARLRSVGFVRMDVLPGAPPDPDTADVNIRFSITNVMNLGDFSDYTGELRASAAVSLTDRAATVPATTPFTFAFDVPCAATADTSLGANCALNTTVDAVLPGAAPEGTRAMWALDRFQVHDGGPDGDAGTTGDNALFATQGLFVP